MHCGKICYQHFNNCTPPTHGAKQEHENRKQCQPGFIARGVTVGLAPAFCTTSIVIEARDTLKSIFIVE